MSRRLTKGSLTELQAALRAMDSATTAITDDVDQWLEHYGFHLTYSRECVKESRKVILENVDDVADAAIALVRILRPHVLKD